MGNQWSKGKHADVGTPKIIGSALYTKGIRFKTVHGLSIEQVENLWKDQGGLCGVCRRTIDNPVRKAQHDHRTRACIDHNHETNKIRGLLCDPCNRSLGYFESRSGSLDRLVEWARRDGLGTEASDRTS